MTSRDLYEAALIELNKLEAPSLLLEDYNYFINKAIQQYVNLVYAKLEIDQQSTDDIRVLKVTSVLDIQTFDSIQGSDGLFKSLYYVDLPVDYMHLLNCIVEYKVNKTNKCAGDDESVFYSAQRLNPELFKQIINNAYLKPDYKRPYYYLNNINSSELPTSKQLDTLALDGIEGATVEQKISYLTALNEYLKLREQYIEALKKGSDVNSAKKAVNTAVQNLYAIKESIVKTLSEQDVDSYGVAGNRVANTSTVRMELRLGKVNSRYTPIKVYVDYLKAPMLIKLTQAQINSTLDTSQVLEFPDYACYEIVNIFTRLLMENSSDPRLQTNVPINNTIANPALSSSE